MGLETETRPGSPDCLIHLHLSECCVGSYESSEVIISLAERRRSGRNGPDPKVFPNQLRAWRERRGFRDAASLARHLGVPASTITRLERGERRPTLSIFCRISRALDVPLDYLVYTLANHSEAEIRSLDRQVLEHVRRRLLQFAAQLGHKDGDGHDRILWELNVWLEQLTCDLRRRVKDGKAREKMRR